MLYQVVIAVGLVCLALNLILNLRSLKTPPRDGKIPKPAPFISVLIPARDEEAHIETCLESLQTQDYPNFEILVLDDNSSDNTASIVDRIAAKDNRIQLITGEALPEDWAGKPFACPGSQVKTFPALRISPSAYYFPTAEGSNPGIILRYPELVTTVVAPVFERP